MYEKRMFNYQLNFNQEVKKSYRNRLMVINDVGIREYFMYLIL
jgi:hypothetical protein